MDFVLRYFELWVSPQPFELKWILEKVQKIKILEITCKKTNSSPLYIQNTHKDIMEYLKQLSIT